MGGRWRQEGDFAGFAQWIHGDIDFGVGGDGGFFAAERAV